MQEMCDQSQGSHLIANGLHAGEEASHGDLVTLGVVGSEEGIPLILHLVGNGGLVHHGKSSGGGVLVQGDDEVLELGAVKLTISVGVVGPDPIFFK